MTHDRLLERIAEIVGYCMATQVSRNNQPDMSGDPRRRIPQAQRRAFDDACLATAEAILKEIGGPMTEIPAELMREAERICRFVADPKTLFADSVLLVAVALRARDKRAAEIVEAEGMAYAGLREGVILARAAASILTYDATSQEGDE